MRERRFTMFQFLAMIPQVGFRRTFLRYLRPTIAAPAIAATVAIIVQTIDTRLVNADQSSRPNIVLIMSDDMGYSDLGCFGGEIKTPNLDQLAYGGLRFTNFYSENMCWVSRAAMLTGVWHLTSFHRKGLHPRCVTIPEILRSGGYSTLMSGKWHLG